MATHPYLVCPECSQNLTEVASSDGKIPSGETRISCPSCGAEFPFGEAARAWMKRATDRVSDPERSVG